MIKTYFRSILTALTFFALMVPQAIWADQLEASTAANPTWFRILPNRENQTVTSHGVGQKLKSTQNATKPYSETMLWRFEKSGTDTYNVVCMDGCYLAPGTKSGNYFTPIATEPTMKWTITAISGTDFYTLSSGKTQLHQGSLQWNEGALMDWGYNNGVNTTDQGCQFKFEKVTLTAIELLQIKAFTVYNNAVEGNNPGQYSAEARAAFKAAINAATTEEAIKTAQTAFEAKMNKVVAGKTYFLKSGPSKAYCEGKYIYSAGSLTQPKWGNKLINGTFAWTFEDAGGGQFYVKNYATGEYIEPNSNDKDGATTTVKTHKTKYTVTSLGQEAFNITPDGKNPLHAQQDGSVLVMWAGGLNSASAWKLETITDEELAAQASIKSMSVNPGFQTYAPGLKENVLLRATAVVEGFNGDVKANSLTLDFGSTTTNPSDLENIKVFTSMNDDFISYDKRKATLVGELAAVTGTTATVPFTNGELTLPTGNTLFYVTADVKASATVGNKVDAAIKSLTYNTDQTLTVNGNPEGVAVIYSVTSKAAQPYDLGSHYWRIPAMVVLHNQTGNNASKNGRVVMMMDNRFNHNTDLNYHIDVYERHSDNNGATWSDHKLVVGSDADHKLINVANNGFGDVALVESAKGRIIAIMVAGQAYFSSTNVRNNSIIPVIITSDDGGETWSSPRTLFDELYKGTYKQGQVLGSFAGSGRGIVLKRQKNKALNGRIMFAMSHRFANSAIQEYIIYSDDEGATWNMSPNSAYNGGDESKLVELADGTVMISVRQNGNRGFNTSTDGGMTWGSQTTNSDISGNACNADILYYNKHILLHSYLNNGKRKNLTIKASLDNGKTWGNPFEVCAPSSGYSTMDITSDGDIALLYEDNACSTGYVINYAKLPLSFIVKGDPAKEAFTSALEKAKKIAAKTGYTNAANAKVNDYSQEAIDKVKAAIPSTTEGIDYDTATDAINAALIEAAASRVTVAGQPNTATFTISSYENVGTEPYFINLSAQTTATTGADQEWQIVPAEAENNVYIKAKDEDKYFIRSKNTAAIATSPVAWVLAKDASNDYYTIKSTVDGSTYLCINLTNGALNYWRSVEGGTANGVTWSTKFALTPKGHINTGIAGVNTTTAAKTVRYYDLNGRRVLRPTKGVYITSDGKKVIK